MNIGILGGGQLGRMLALAGYPLDLHFRFIDPTPDATAGQIAEQLACDYTDLPMLDRFTQGLTVATYEFENVPAATAAYLAERVSLYPPPRALEVAQDRVVEKTFFRQLGIPTTPFMAVGSCLDLESAQAEIGLPAVLKTRRLGYDGKGQAVLRRPDEFGDAWKALSDTRCIVEQFVCFDRELSMLAVRSRHGEAAFYPLIENHHRDGILRLSIAPAPGLSETLQQQAQDYTGRILDALQYVGVLAVEYFHVGDQLLANEMAPRVHNSGHWTIEGSATSQFENHLRAILGWPLGATDMIGYCGLVNLIGTVPDVASMLAVPGAHVHLYGKAARSRRKLGHVTIQSDDRIVMQAGVARVCQLLAPDS